MTPSPIRPSGTPGPDGANGETGDVFALHKAAKEGDAARVRELLAAGADPNAADWTANTPLHRAPGRPMLRRLGFCQKVAPMCMLRTDRAGPRSNGRRTTARSPGCSAGMAPEDAGNE